MSEAILSRSRRRRGVQGLSTARFLLWSAVLVGSGALLYAITTTLLLPYLRIDRVVVQADFEIDRGVLLQRAGLAGPVYFHTVDPALVQARLETIPQIRSVGVEKAFPDTIKLTMQRRRPLLITLLPGETESVPAVIDEDGVIYARGSELATLDLPLISGITYRGEIVGSRLPDMLVDVVTRLQALRVEEPQLFRALSEIRVDPRTAGEFDLLVYNKTFRVPVRMGSDLTLESFAYALMILDVLVQQGIDDAVEELDFRSGEIVYRMKEDESAR